MRSALEGTPTDQARAMAVCAIRGWGVMVLVETYSERVSSRARLAKRKFVQQGRRSPHGQTTALLRVCVCVRVRVVPLLAVAVIA